MSSVPFIDGCVQGLYLVEEIDDFVHTWHTEKPQATLSEFLGMSRDEYDLWIADDDVLPLIIAAREKKRSIKEIVDDVNEYALAVRASGGADTSSVMRWLRRHDLKSQAK